jgi:4-amino-4-deoxy-L-arabinose transferase-like glycosyltransferase
VRPRLNRIALVVGAILAVALILRVVEVQRTDYRPINDAGSYLGLASEIAHIGNYSNDRRPGSGAGSTRGPSAYFPPGYPYLLAGVDLIDGHTATSRVHGHTRIPAGAVHGARIANALLGTLTVALVGLVALEGIGALVALIALLMAAIYPVFIGLSGTLVAENLATPLILAAIWAALRARRSPHPFGWMAAAGVLEGLATLTHVNAVVAVVPLVALAWGVVPRAAGARRWRTLMPAGLLVGCLVLTLSPWLVRNAVAMHRFVFVSDETGITLVGTYNSASAAYRPVPYKWRIYYGIPGEQTLIDQAPRLTEAQLSDRLQTQALHYISDHPLSPVLVAFDNSQRLLELEGSFAWHASAAAISEPIGVARIGVVGFWILCLLAVAGALTRAARAAWRWLWIAPLLLWLSVALVNAETPRFREPVDPFLIVIGACAVAAAVEWAAARLGRAPVARGHVGTLAGGPGQRVEVGERLA